MQKEATKQRTEYSPLTFTKHQLEDMRSEGVEFAFVNSNKSVWIKSITHGNFPGHYLVSGYVESENKKRKGTCFWIETVIANKRNNSIPWSNCSCTSAHYGMNPCHHAVRMRDVFLANMRDMLKTSVRM